MDGSSFAKLPDELLEAIIFYLPPKATVAFAKTCRHSNKVAYEPLVWRQHCIQAYRYWEPSHDIKARLKQPPAQTKWRLLFNERKQIDNDAMELFEALLSEQQFRVERMEKMAAYGYDIKDLMLAQRDETSEDAEDVLARRYHANAILGQIHRGTAMDKWTRLQQRQMVRLEEVLGAFDLFVLNGRRDLDEIDAEFDRLADAIKARDPDWEYLSVRKRAIQIAKYLRAERLVGNQSADEYHALRNNFISLALFDEPHTSLPLQSVAIYCAVARRLGVNAKPSNYPHHVHAVIEAPADVDLDGKPRPAASVSALSAALNREKDLESASEVMHLDPWRSSDETPRTQLTTRLTQMGAPPNQQAYHLGATTNLEMVMRTGRNIMNSVQEARDRQRGTTRRAPYPDGEGAWYAMLWSMILLGDNSNPNTLHRRRQCLPYLVEHYQAHFPQDLNLIETIIAPMFESEREHSVLMRLITTARAADGNKRAPSYRPKKEDMRWGVLPIPGEGGVSFKVGTFFQHKRFGYEGMIVGWDTRCDAEPRWIEQMRVDDLPRGREQPFYNVVADDKSIRYVAEENIHALHEPPGETMLGMAGRYFKRWDRQLGMFVSNIRDEYPDD